MQPPAGLAVRGASPSLPAGWPLVCLVACHSFWHFLSGGVWGPRSWGHIAPAGSYTVWAGVAEGLCRSRVCFCSAGLRGSSWAAMSLEQEQGSVCRAHKQTSAPSCIARVCLSLSRCTALSTDFHLGTFSGLSIDGAAAMARAAPPKCMRGGSWWCEVLCARVGLLSGEACASP